MMSLAVIQLICAVLFAVDLMLEFPDPSVWLHLNASDSIHLFSEIAVMVLLVVGFALARFAVLKLQSERDRLRSDLRSLRGEFDAILQARFATWNLSPAQRDVALLTLRGLRIADIARLRGCAEGTVKAHLSAVFRAAGVATRNELQGLFMDEFLDFGADSDAADQKRLKHPVQTPAVMLALVEWSSRVMFDISKYEEYTAVILI